MLHFDHVARRCLIICQRLFGEQDDRESIQTPLHADYMEVSLLNPNHIKIPF
jgi:hypothetical protein